MGFNSGFKGLIKFEQQKTQSSSPWNLQPPVRFVWQKTVIRRPEGPVCSTVSNPVPCGLQNVPGLVTTVKWIGTDKNNEQFARGIQIICALRYFTLQLTVKVLIYFVTNKRAAYIQFVHKHVSQFKISMCSTKELTFVKDTCTQGENKNTPWCTWKC